MEIKNLHFYDARLRISQPSRFLTRLFFYSSYAVLTAGAATFLFSDVKKLFWLGFLIMIFLVDRVVHLRQSDKPMSAKIPENANIADYFAPVSFHILESAFNKALGVGGNFYIYILNFLVKLPEIKQGLLRMDVDAEKLEQNLEGIIESGKSLKISKKDLLDSVEFTAKLAFISALNLNNRSVEPIDLFSALGQINDLEIIKIFTLFEINSVDLGKAMIFRSFKKSFWQRLPKSLGGFAHHPKKIKHRIMNRAWTSRPTPALDNFSIDLTDLAAMGQVGFLIGHQQEYERFIDVLSRSIKPNALLIGEPGSGKETLVSALAHAIIKDEVPESLFDKRVVSLQLGNLVAGVPAAEISSRLNKIVEEIVASGNIVLYIPDIHNLVKTSEGNLMNAADILMPVINNDIFPIIGGTYPKEFKQFIEPLSDFTAAFENIRIEEIGEDDAVKILTYDSLILERQRKITISFSAIKASVELAHKYFRQKLLPASAQDLLRETIAFSVAQKGRLIKANEVIAVVEREINIPVQRPGKVETEKLLNLESIIHQSLIDQEQAVLAVSRALREYRSGLSRKGGPIASFLFVGPTGVGKTELSKILAKIQFGSENAMARFDMSEYQTKESISRLIGTPDGKMGGSLTDAIIQKPFSLVLLDEFEKAHPDILNLFLQVFDDGRLTDSLGRTVDFTNTIIIATSNAHSNFIKERIEAGDNAQKINEELKKKLTEYFRPELLNRFSQIIFFKNLSREDTLAVARLQLKSLVKSLEERGIGFICDEAAVKKIAELGYDPVFGARPLRAVISDKLRSVLAEKILKGEIAKGDSIKAVIGADSEIEFVKQ